MPIDDVAPPGESPLDPKLKDIDPLAFALERVHTMLVWIDEHRSSFEAARTSNPEQAERELGFLADATQQARNHHNRAVELILSGYVIDRGKRQPNWLTRRD